MIAYGAGAGIFGVELFLLEDGRLLLNEVAPRPHNSGAFPPLSSDVCVRFGWPSPAVAAVAPCLILHVHVGAA